MGASSVTDAHTSINGGRAAHFDFFVSSWVNAMG
jgi:hypothetical protein